MSRFQLTSTLTHRTWPWALGIGCVTFVFSLLRQGAILNDEYIYIARAHQLLRGDWPLRNFEDAGYTLHYLLPALAARVGGPTLLSEAVLWLLLFAIAVAATFTVARRASGSLGIGIAAAALIVRYPPRLYNVSKALVPVIAIALAWRYVDRRRQRDLVGLGAWTGVALLFRLDYSVYVATAATLMLVVAWHRSPGLAARSILVYGVAVAIVISPWLIYIQAEEGLSAFFEAALRFAAAERARTVPTWPAVFYVVTLIPVTVLALCVRGTRTLPTAAIVFATTLTLVSDLALLRDPPAARLPDVYATTAIIVAIAIGRWMPAPRDRIARLPVSAVVAGALILMAGAGVVAPLAWARWTRIATRLREARPEVMPVPALAPLVRFIERCTSPSDRVIVGGFGPELPVLAHRAFAGGIPQWLPGYYVDAADVARARAQLAREHVGIAVMLEGGDTFRSSWPAIAADLRARGLATYLFPQTPQAIELWLPPSPMTDTDTGLPCHHESRGPF